MHRRTFMKMAATAASIAILPVTAERSFAMSNASYADVNGQRIFYETHGFGKPLILLHGGVSPDAFGANLAELAKTRQVIAVHLQGHGRTPDSERPLRYELLADDIAALVRHLGLGKVDLMGYSLGGGTALQTAIRHPEVVDRLVLISVTFRQEGSYPEVLAAFEQMEANAPAIGAGVKASALGERYPEVDWVNLFRKIGDMTKRPYDWGSDLEKMTARTLLVFADADSIRPEHMIEFYGLLGGGQRDAGLDGSLRAPSQLAIIPNATHYDIAVNPQLTGIVNGFLDAG